MIQIHRNMQKLKHSENGGAREQMVATQQMVELKKCKNRWTWMEYGIRGGNELMDECCGWDVAWELAVVTFLLTKVVSWETIKIHKSKIENRHIWRKVWVSEWEFGKWYELKNTSSAVTMHQCDAREYSKRTRRKLSRCSSTKEKAFWLKKINAQFRI